jgi:hypothetical protein
VSGGAVVTSLVTVPGAAALAEAIEESLVHLDTVAALRLARELMALLGPRAVAGFKRR